MIYGTDHGTTPSVIEFIKPLHEFDDVNLILRFDSIIRMVMVSSRIKVGVVA